MHDSTDAMLSEGSRRCLAAAARSAQTRDAEQVTTLDLLLALWHDETLAFDILSASSVTPQGIVDTLAEGMTSEAAEMLFAELSLAGAGAVTVSLPDQQTVLDTIASARRLAQSQGRHVEVGTNHLLWGLIDADADVRELLESCGVTQSCIAETFDLPTDETGDPLPVDVDLQMADADGGERHNILRILDAAANRATEGIRVVEDHVRFIGNNARLSGDVKQFRHDVATACRRLPFHERLSARNTPADVGTALSTSSERTRRDAADVLRANLKRISESLRSLEEYGKIVDAPLSQQFEALRYRSYSIEQRVLSTIDVQQRLANRRLYLLLTSSRHGNEWERIAAESLAGGVDVIQLREKDVDDRSLLETTERLRELTTEAGALLIINDRPDIAILCGADGVHLGQDDMTVAHARRIVGPQAIVGVSTHSLAQAKQAVADGADYIGVGPVFPSTTKQFDTFCGVELVLEVTAKVELPCFAIGGMTTSNVAQLTDAGCGRIAVSGAVCDADEPRSVAETMKSSLQPQASEA